MEIRKITKKMLVSTIAENLNEPKRLVRDVFVELESVIMNELTNSPDDEDLEIKLFQGLVIVKQIMGEKTMKNPNTGEYYTVPSKCKVRAKVGKHLKKTINK